MSQVSHSWDRIRRWLGEHASELTLTSGATEDQINEVEKTTGLTFPDSLRESYLCQNGNSYEEGELCVLPGSFEAVEGVFLLLPIEEVAKEWEIWKDLIDSGEFKDIEGTPDDDGIETVWWSDGWLPIGGNGGGDFICVDMKPTESGTVGQVIMAWHDMDDRTLLASSMDEYLKKIADAVENGVFEWEEDELALVES